MINYLPKFISKSNYFMLCYLDDSKNIMIHLRIKQIINYKYTNAFEVKIYEKIKKNLIFSTFHLMYLLYL